jgi:SAM-dependent methyltransferase
MNIILNDAQREKYQPVIEELFALCPETMQRKIPRANVQQAFVLDTVRRLSTPSSKLLCVGSYEDTACEALIKLGYNVVAIDPAINMSLDTFFQQADSKFDAVFSTSVIEHVKDDEIFLDQICKLTKSNGYGVLTCDFRDDYNGNKNKPGEDVRLYTKNDLLVRLKKILTNNHCSLHGTIDYDYPPDFHYGIYIYSFATYVFRKI